jgi:hypothetical protein
MYVAEPSVSVRKRSWVSKGVSKDAWVVDFVDLNGKRRLKTFKTKADADRFRGLSAAVRSGAVPEPLTAKWFRPIEFVTPLPDGTWRNGTGREELAGALRSTCPMLEPTTDSVILHIIAEMPPRYVVADVDNLLKPVLDSLKGIAWLDDTQVCELLVRRIPGRLRRLRIRLWQIPRTVVAPHLNALMDAGLIKDW